MARIKSEGRNSFIKFIKQSYGQIASNKVAYLILTFVMLYTVVLLTYTTLTMYDDPKKYKNTSCKNVKEGEVLAVLFDLDDTLYWSPALRDEIHKNVLQYLIEKLRIPQAEANNISDNMYKKYGTTLAALVALGYDVNITDFHMNVFSLSYAQYLREDRSVVDAVRKIILPKFIFTNGNHFHTERALSQLGFTRRDFDGIISFDTLMGNFIKKDGHLNREMATNIICKPSAQAYERSIEIVSKQLGGTKICPQQVVLVDDSTRNIEEANKAQLQTVLITHGAKSSLRPTSKRIVISKLDQLQLEANYLFQN
eukprot:TRINITY_DN7740_c0_g1_i1.p1 TRINITY_DN7740_c0_g1~~TRINITY_DN7740_c0_g1_i1.p1  ORF type:complete len:311 (-),score=33.32 TRINITY_DN7740_c0_g1_i1:290-1222(-)